MTVDACGNLLIPFNKKKLDIKKLIFTYKMFINMSSTVFAAETWRPH